MLYFRPTQVLNGVSSYLLLTKPKNARVPASSLKASFRTSLRSSLSYIDQRYLAFKPLLVENRFPKIEESMKPPLEIKLKKSERYLWLKWEGGCEMKLPAEYLRVESPSAEVQGHGGANEKRLIYGRKFVNIIGIEPQGHYGILLKFDDMHDTGIYSWSYLHYLGANKMAIMKQYIKDLRRAGKHRDPRLNNQPRQATNSSP